MNPPSETVRTKNIKLKNNFWYDLRFIVYSSLCILHCPTSQACKDNNMNSQTEVHVFYSYLSRTLDAFPHGEIDDDEDCH